jgi:hypothetical protein
MTLAVAAIDALGVRVVLSQHPDEHGPRRPLLPAVYQGIGEGAALRVPPEFADPIGSLEVGSKRILESRR